MATPVGFGAAGDRLVAIGGAVCSRFFVVMNRIPPTNSSTRMAPVTVRDETRRDLLRATISPAIEVVTLCRFTARRRNLTTGTVLAHAAVHAQPDDPRHHDPFD